MTIDWKPETVSWFMGLPTCITLVSYVWHLCRTPDRPTDKSQSPGMAIGDLVSKNKTNITNLFKKMCFIYFYIIYMNKRDFFC